MQSNTPQTTNFLRLPQVRKIAGGVAPSTIWGWVKSGTFPQLHRMGRGASRSVGSGTYCCVT